MMEGLARCYMKALVNTIDCTKYKTAVDLGGKGLSPLIFQIATLNVCVLIPKILWTYIYIHYFKIISLRMLSYTQGCIRGCT